MVRAGFRRLTRYFEQLELWSQTYAPGTYVSTNYVLTNAKISFDYLSWPYPVEGRHFRLKTLWQVQFTSIRTGFDAPQLPLVNSAGSPILDSSGNPISYAGLGTNWFISPELGLGASYYSGRHLRFDANASGFAIPHHNTVWDADVSANLRFGHVEFRAGFKAFHFKTSSQADILYVGNRRRRLRGRALAFAVGAGGQGPGAGDLPVRVRLPFSASAHRWMR